MPRTIKKIELKQANLSHQQMENAIPKIERRILEIEQFDVDSINERYDPRIRTLSTKLEELLASIFGSDTVEYERYHWNVTHLDTASMNMMHSTPLEEVKRGLRKGFSTSKMILESIKSGFLEELEDAGLGNTGKTLKAYEGLELNPMIEKASGQLFRDGHYSNAVEDSVKALNAYVRLCSGVEDKDGSALMEFVFNSNNPILKFNSLNDQSDKDEQKGFMLLLSGAVIGLRNPRAHKIIKDDPQLALEFIAFISLLTSLVEKSKK